MYITATIATIATASVVAENVADTVRLSDVPAVNVTAVKDTELTESVAGRLAAALSMLLDVATPVLTAASVNQTGDAYVRLGAPAGASVSADVAAVKADTAAVKAKTDNLPSDPADQSAVEAAITAATGALALEASVQGYGTLIYNNTTTLVTNVGTPSNLGSGASLAKNMVDIEAQTDDIGTAGAGLTALATAAELAKVPKSDGSASWNATALAAINAQADTALADYDAPTKTEMDAAFTAIKGATWNSGTDTLEAIRDRGDAAWTTADVSDLPTNSELATALASADDAVLTAIADVPTVAEFEARTLPSADYTVVSDLPSVPSAADIKAALEADGSKLDHVWEMTEDDGGVRRLTANALEEAPAGGSGTADWTSDEREQIRYRLQLDGTQTAPADTDLPSVNVTMQQGVAVAAADANGNVPVSVLAWRGAFVDGAENGFINVNNVLGVVQGNVQGAVEGSVGSLGSTAQQNVRDAMKLAPSAGAPAAGSVDKHLDDILTTIGGEIVEGTYTRDDILRIIAAALAGETSGSGTATVEILGLDGATTRITATLDGNGNRTSMTLDGT